MVGSRYSITYLADSLCSVLTTLLAGTELYRGGPDCAAARS